MQTRLKYPTDAHLFFGPSLTILLYIIPNEMIVFGNTIWICGRVREWSPLSGHQ